MVFLVALSALGCSRGSPLLPHHAVWRRITWRPDTCKFQVADLNQVGTPKPLRPIFFKTRRASRVILHILLVSEAPCIWYHLDGLMSCGKNRPASLSRPASRLRRSQTYILTVSETWLARRPLVSLRCGASSHLGVFPAGRGNQPISNIDAPLGVGHNIPGVTAT